MSQDINDKWLNSIFNPVTANNFDLEETETSPVYQIEDAIPSTSYTIPTTSYGGEKKSNGERAKEGKMPKSHDTDTDTTRHGQGSINMVIM